MNADEIRARLGLLKPEPRLDFKFEGLTDLAQSAVLIPLRDGPHGPELVLTKRSEALRKHAGQISFPGGRRDPEDVDLAATALREAWEELAIQPEDVRLYGALLRLPTVTGFNVTAFVGELPHPYTLTPNPAEVAHTIIAPIEALLDPAIYTRERHEWQGKVFDMHAFDFEGHNIWGATGFMIYEFLKFLEMMK
ncbi:CoA pyrophosphatase [Microvenator marinus]|uniref:CoA pyrophosphatase n=1 Tax=Microvenator marinus TaxID=2600177 RepID=A0A5B8XQG1_9DELT|nr:CoA pyrophosphatase [Microvenator marinus]QED27531.1 CoA pyrophosphatase [Microvenator marinus]